MPPLPSIFPDYSAPIVRNSAVGRELAMARWGMPSPMFALKGAYIALHNFAKFRAAKR